MVQRTRVKTRRGREVLDKRNLLSRALEGACCTKDPFRYAATLSGGLFVTGCFGAPEEKRNANMGTLELAFSSHPTSKSHYRIQFPSSWFHRSDRHTGPRIWLHQ